MAMAWISVAAAEDGLDLFGHRGEGREEALALGAGHVAHPRHVEGEEVEGGELAREGLGRGDGDLGAGVDVDAAVGLARDGRAHDVADAQDVGALALDLAHRVEGVGGLAGLGHCEPEAVALDDGVAVAQLARDVGRRRGCARRTRGAGRRRGWRASSCRRR